MAWSEYIHHNGCHHRSGAKCRILSGNFLSLCSLSNNSTTSQKFLNSFLEPCWFTVTVDVNSLIVGWTVNANVPSTFSCCWRNKLVWKMECRALISAYWISFEPLFWPVLNKNHSCIVLAKELWAKWNLLLDRQYLSIFVMSRNILSYCYCCQWQSSQPYTCLLKPCVTMHWLQWPL